MKRYNNLFNKICDYENIEIAHQNAQKGKKHYREVRKINKKPNKYLTKIQQMLLHKTFKNSPYRIITKTTDNGKVREIYKLPYFPDRIIHHAIMQVLEQIWFSTLIRDTYSAIKGRGIHDGVKRIKKALKNKNETKFCLKCDVKKYYPSINNNILAEIIRKKIKDKNVLWLLDEIIYSTNGLPIGNYLSQYFGNLYLSEFDHWLKEKQNVKYYFRYCDDFIVLHSSKSFLHDLQYKISDYLYANRSLNIKSNWQVFPTNVRGIDFLGYRFFYNYVLLRKSIKHKFKIKVKTINRNWEKMTQSQIVNSIMSYYGWLAHANCNNLFNKYIDDKIFEITKNICYENQTNNPLQGIN